MKKTCPACKAAVLETVCACGYDFMMDDCPGCDKRIPEGSIVCPLCQYDILTGTPAKVKKTKRTPSVALAQVITQNLQPIIHEEPIKSQVAGGLRINHVVTLGHFGRSDSKYIELLWPADQEVTDESLYQWADDFRKAYTDKVRSTTHLSNRAISHWCRYSATLYAAQNDKRGRNDVLRDNADRILKLLGGNDCPW